MLDLGIEGDQQEQKRCDQGTGKGGENPEGDARQSNGKEIKVNLKLKLVYCLEMGKKATLGNVPCVCAKFICLSLCVCKD